MGMRTTQEKASWYKRAQQYDLGGDIRIEHYGNRYWAIYLGGELLAVTVYFKGAVAIEDVIRRLQRMNTRIEPMEEMMGMG